MRILVLSDSHGDEFSCGWALERHREADAVVHLGDGEEDMDSLQALVGNRPLLRVRGNAPYSAFYGCPESLCEDLGGRRFYLTHGYRERVKFGLDGLIAAARGAGAEVALFGHTHKQYGSYVDGLYLLNPGSVRRGDYALLDITRAGIVLLPQRL